MRVAMTDNYRTGDRYEIELSYFDATEVPMTVEFYVPENQAYMKLGQLGGGSGQWRQETFEIPPAALAGGFENVVPVSHGYHRMNYDYLFKLHEMFPNEKLIAMARRWQAKETSA